MLDDFLHTATLLLRDSPWLVPNFGLFAIIYYIFEKSIAQERYHQKDEPPPLDYIHEAALKWTISMITVITPEKIKADRAWWPAFIFLVWGCSFHSSVLCALTLLSYLYYRNKIRQVSLGKIYPLYRNDKEFIAEVMDYCRAFKEELFEEALLDSSVQEELNKRVSWFRKRFLKEAQHWENYPNPV